MKKGFLVILLCVFSVAVFAQTKGKKTVAKKGTTAGKKPVVKGKAGTGKKGTNSTGSTTLPQETSVKDSVPKVAQLPARPFERPLDSYFKKSSILSAKVTPYAPLREADVAMLKRVWREIDLREKMNNYMASPKARLIDVLMQAVSAGELTAYDPTPNPDVAMNDPDGDSFSRPLKPGEAKNRMSDSSLVEIRDKDNNVTSSKMTANDFNPDSILRFRIKEDWIFDKQRSVWEPRIIGIAPLFKPKVGAVVGEVDYIPAFWIYFPDARQVLAVKEIVVKDNDATGLSYDDAFMKRMFTGPIVKVSNNKNDRIKDYKQGIDKLYESERIKKELMDWELDLWQY